MSAPLYGCIEAGGTKFVCAVGRAPDDIRAKVRIPTTSPAETLAAVRAFFEAESAGVAAYGIGSFGPVDIDRPSPGWGRLRQTPKPGWPGADIVSAVGWAGKPVGLDTDVNAALLGEARWGAARGVANAVYLTVGTGIGGGVMAGGQPVHGLRHPEMGHLYLKRHPDDDFAGGCPYHGDCAEGLANGPAIERRWGASLSHLPPEHPGHEIIAFYVAQLCVAAVATLSVERIVIGGGVFHAPGLIERVRAAADRLAGDYFGDPVGERVVPTGLGDLSGIAGAMVLAERALAEEAGLGGS